MSRLIGAEVVEVRRIDTRREEDISMIVLEKDGKMYEIKSHEAMVDKERR